MTITAENTGPGRWHIVAAGFDQGVIYAPDREELAFVLRSLYVEHQLVFLN